MPSSRDHRRIVARHVGDGEGQERAGVAGGAGEAPALDPICERRGIALPPAAAALLAEGGNESPKPGDPLFAVAAAVSASIGRATIRNSAWAKSGSPGFGLSLPPSAYEPELLGADLEGEAREVAAEHAAIARARAAEGRRR
jgi:glycerate 2-kinase